MRTALAFLLGFLLCFAALWYVTGGNVPAPHCVKPAQAHVSTPANCPTTRARP